MVGIKDHMVKHDNGFLILGIITAFYIKHGIGAANFK